MKSGGGTLAFFLLACFEWGCWCRRGRETVSICYSTRERVKICMMSMCHST